MLILILTARSASRWLQGCTRGTRGDPSPRAMMCRGHNPGQGVVAISPDDSFSRWEKVGVPGAGDQSADVLPYHRGLLSTLASSYRPRTSAILAPMTAGDSATCTPASSKMRIFSDARAALPVMIAPACPIRFPGGAV